MRRITIWDLPTRIFHWTLLLFVVGAFVSAQIGGNAMVWHGRFGAGVLGLLVFRLAWGFLGSTYARFQTFVRGPQAIVAHLRGNWHGVGHSPLGALSVLALVLVLKVQGLTGLLANDDIAFQGPYAMLVSNNLSAWFTSLHKTNVWVLGVLIAMHLGALVFYTLVKRDNLVKPMVLGYKDVDQEAFKSATGGGLGALLVALMMGGAAFWAAHGGLVPLLKPPSPPPATIHTW